MTPKQHCNRIGHDWTDLPDGNGQTHQCAHCDELGLTVRPDSSHHGVIVDLQGLTVHDTGSGWFHHSGGLTNPFPTRTEAILDAYETL